MRIPRLILGACLALAACDDSTGPAGEATMVVRVVTAGGDFDLDGYLLDVDGRVSFPIGVGATQELTLEAGRHVVEISEVAANCAVQGDHVREVVLSQGERIEVSFSVICGATGVSVRTSTTGLDPDPNGYQILLDGVPNRTMGSTATAVLSRLSPGVHELEITGIASSCEADGPTTRTVTVVNAELTPVEFPVACRAAWAVIRVEASTTGSDPDGQYHASLVALPGYATQVDGGSGTILQVPGGTHQVQLADVAANCAVPGGATREATVTVGGAVRDTAEVVFTVECVSDRGTVRVTVATSGTTPPGPHRVDLWYYDCYYCPPVESRETEASGNGTVEFTPRSGAYFVTLAPAQGCSVSGSSPGGPLAVTLGAVLEAQFDVGCGPAQLRITAPTSGTSPDTEYSVTLWYSDGWYGSVSIPLGTLAAGGTLTAEAPFAGWFWVSLGDVAANCTVQVPNPSAWFDVAYGQTTDVSFPVVCGS